MIFFKAAYTRQTEKYNSGFEIIDFKAAYTRQTQFLIVQSLKLIFKAAYTRQTHLESLNMRHLVFKAAYTRQTVMRFYYTSQFPALSLYLDDSPITKIFINFQEVFVLYFRNGFCLDPHNSSQ